MQSCLLSINNDDDDSNARSTTTPLCSTDLSQDVTQQFAQVGHSHCNYITYTYVPKTLGIEAAHSVGSQLEIKKQTTFEIEVER